MIVHGISEKAMNIPTKDIHIYDYLKVMINEIWNVMIILTISHDFPMIIP